MKSLHIFKSEPDHNTQLLIDILSGGDESATFSLYEAAPDYERLIDLIFDHDRVVTWW
jgi:hypothetical protein